MQMHMHMPMQMHMRVHMHMHMPLHMQMHMPMQRGAPLWENTQEEPYRAPSP